MPRASLQSSRRVWGCPRSVLECPGSVHVRLGVPGAIQKGLEMFQRGLGGHGGSLGGFRGSCCLLEGSEDVPEVSWGVQGLLVWVWGVLEPSRRVWRCPRKALEGPEGPPVDPLGSADSSRRVWSCPGRILWGPGGLQVSPGHPCSHPEGSGGVPGVSWSVQGVFMWVWGVLEPSRRVWRCPREDLEGPGGL